MVDSRETKSNRVGIEVSSSSFRAVAIDAIDVISATFSAVVDLAEARGPQLVGFITGLKKEFGDFDRIGISFPGLVASHTESALGNPLAA